MSEPSLLKDIFIAAPCEVGWDNMQGLDGGERTEVDKVRFCGSCSLNVFNLSGMSDAEAEALLRSKQETGERVCISLFRRTDGTVLTQNCPRGLALVRERVSTGLQKVATFLAVLTSASLWLPSWAQTVPGADQKKTPTRLGGSPPPLNVPYQNRTAGIVAPMPRKPDATQPVNNEQGSQPGNAKPKASKESVHAAEIKSAADHDAFNQFTLAQTNESAGNCALAETQYKQALKLGSHKKHDPAFAKNVAQSYAGFLRKQQRESEALKIEKQYKLNLNKY